MATTIKIDGIDKELTVEEAREILRTLEELVGDKYKNIYPLPIVPCPMIPNYPIWHNWGSTGTAGTIV